MADWHKGGVTALPGSKVLVFGALWVSVWTPWVYDLKRDTWSHKLTPDGKDVPPLSKCLQNGTAALLLENKVYMFHDYDAYVLDLSSSTSNEWAWETFKLPMHVDDKPQVVPFSPEKVFMIGGGDTEHFDFSFTRINTQTRQFDRIKGPVPHGHEFWKSSQ